MIHQSKYILQWFIPPHSLKTKNSAHIIKNNKGYDNIKDTKLLTLNYCIVMNFPMSHSEVKYKSTGL